MKTHTYLCLRHLSFLLTLTLLFSACSPFGNSSVIDTISKTIPFTFLNAPTPTKASVSGGQIVTSGAGYRMNVGISNSTSRLNNTCNAQGYCMEVAISR